MEKKILPIGTSDYKNLIDKNFYYVDKTLLIKELTERGGLVTLLPRPRRFGKTLALSMLRYFYESSPKSNAYLFENKKIWQTSERELQGKFPVIFLTFKDVKESNWQSAYEKMRDIIAIEFKRHEDVLRSTLTSVQDKNNFDAIYLKTASQATFEQSLLFLSSLLYKHYQQKVVVLVDEYDSPIHAAYMHQYYDPAVNFMRNFLGGVFKDNSSLERGVITGILRTAKEGIFSGLNNLKVSSMVDNDFADKFGFTQAEVDQFLADYDYLDKKDEVKEWYNGYQAQELSVYNPWSVLRYVDSSAQTMLFWANTSDNSLVNDTIKFSSASIKKDLESIINGTPVRKIIPEGITMGELKTNENAVWALLYFSGYLTYSHKEISEGKWLCNLVVPNKEVKYLYKELIEFAFKSMLTPEKAAALLNALVTGDVELFAELFQEYVASSVSMFDVGGDEPEKTYHMFVLGLLIMLSGTHIIKSNRESGYGRYDIMIIPKDRTKLGIVIEFKRVRSTEDIQHIAQSAIKQIKDKNYAQELRDLGITQVLELGIAFKGKHILVLQD